MTISGRKLEKLRWLVKRLKKAPPQEVFYRLHTAFRIGCDRLYYVKWNKKTTPLAASGFKWSLASKTDQALQSVLKELNRDQVAKDGSDCLAQRYELFGETVVFDRKIDFQRDPKTGKSWPLKFFNDIDYRFNKDLGGIKFAWELNRLHHWPRLALAFRVTGDERYVNKVFDELDLWLASNPYPLGINWISGIELGIRIVNLYFFLMLSGKRDLSDARRQNIETFVWLHGRHLRRYPSKFSSCANHALAEALGLFVAGVAFDHLPGARKWRRFGQKVLEREASRQIYPDGSSFEHSIPYLQFVADHFLVFYLLCRRYDMAISTAVQKRLKAVCRFIDGIIDENGNAPMVGDDDDGHLLKLWFGVYNNWHSLLNTGRRLFKKADFLHATAIEDTKTSILLAGLDGLSSLAAEDTVADGHPAVYFQNAGLAVIKDEAGGRKIHFVGNSGPLGLKPLSGHGHADALSFWMSVMGQPVFVDPGTYLYHGGGPWRRYFRSTAAHNTILVDDKDQAQQISDFMFGDFYTISDVEFSDTPQQIFWAAAHDGYRCLADPLVHHRSVTYKKKKRRFEIVDSLDCRAHHEIKLLFHLHPDIVLKPLAAGQFQLQGQGWKLLLKIDTPMTVNHYFGSEKPLWGWYSPGFNRLQQSNTLVFSKSIQSNAQIKSEVRVL